MKFIDTYSEETYSMTDMHRMWKEFKVEDHENHADSFLDEMAEIMMATINGRNDLEIVGMTASEISRITVKLLRRMN